MAGTTVIKNGVQFGPGLSIFTTSDLVHTPEQVKATPGLLYSVTLDNSGNAAVRYVQFFNALIPDVSVGTTVADFVLPMPASTSASNGIITFHWPQGVDFSIGIAIAATTTPTGSTSPGIVNVNAFYL